MTITFSLCLPRDSASVPVVRRLLGGSFQELGVESECLADIQLAVTEACSNVLHHASGTDDEYEVTVEMKDAECAISVTDSGRGFDHTTLEADAHPSDESGRGIQLMRALVDKVEFTSREQVGTVVHLEKQLVWTDGSLIKQMTEGQPTMHHGPWSSDEHLEDAPQPT